MKALKYKHMTEINYGTEEQPLIVQTFNDAQDQCDDSSLEECLALAKELAYNGEYTIEDVLDNRSLDEVRVDKLSELSTCCNSAITAGVDVETIQGIEHFSLQETDQINLTTALSAIQDGASVYPYHADGQLCRLFSAKEIQDISEASIAHKLYHTTLCNHLFAWVRRINNKDEIINIKYSMEGMPEDLVKNMANILAGKIAI